MIKNSRIYISSITVIFFIINYGYCNDKMVQVWGKQIGTSEHDVSRSVVPDDAGNVYITGYSEGKLGEKRFGKHDIFITKYNSDGNRLWIQQWGTKEADRAVQIIYQNNHLYICGETLGNLACDNIGNSDGFFCKVNTEGRLLWTRQFGTDSADAANSIAVDHAGNSYIFLTKYRSKK